MKSNKFIIQTNKGYICEKNANGVYTKRVADYYNHFMNGGGFFGMNGCSNNAVDKLGFTNDLREATTYSACVGNRVQEVIDRINAGFEDVNEITIKIITDASLLVQAQPNYDLAIQHEDKGE